MVRYVVIAKMDVIDVEDLISRSFFSDWPTGVERGFAKVAT